MTRHSESTWSYVVMCFSPIAAQALLRSQFFGRLAADQSHLGLSSPLFKADATAKIGGSRTNIQSIRGLDKCDSTIWIAEIRDKPWWMVIDHVNCCVGSLFASFTRKAPQHLQSSCSPRSLSFESVWTYRYSQGLDCLPLWPLLLSHGENHPGVQSPFGEHTHGFSMPMASQLHSITTNFWGQEITVCPGAPPGLIWCDPSTDATVQAAAVTLAEHSMPLTQLKRCGRSCVLGNLWSSWGKKLRLMGMGCVPNPPKGCTSGISWVGLEAQLWLTCLSGETQNKNCRARPQLDLPSVFAPGC